MATDRYDHPNFTISRQAHMAQVQAPSASLTDFARFRTRNKCKVTHVTVHCTSLPSALTSFSVQVMRAGATTIGAKTVTSFSVVGDMSLTITMSSLNTLVSSGNYISLQFDSVEKGKFDVMWEYILLSE